MITYFDKKGSLKTCEDSLTATVFGSLKYLPAAMFWKILKASLYHDKLPSECGELRSISFWDKWSAENTTNTNFVEPDVFIRFDELDIIIEAKRLNENQQSSEQLSNEITAYCNEFKSDDKQLCFIQCGGLHDKGETYDYTDELHGKECTICKTDWTRILDVIVTAKKQLIGNYEYDRLFEDIIKGMELHQYYKKHWLSELCPSKTDFNNYSLKNLFSYARH